MKEGKLTIGRTTSNVENDYISIDLILPDRKIRLKLTLEEYGLVISGMGHVPIKIVQNIER